VAAASLIIKSLSRVVKRLSGPPLSGAVIGHRSSYPSRFHDAKGCCATTGRCRTEASLVVQARPRSLQSELLVGELCAPE
jgi:hypothetical protein